MVGMLYVNSERLWGRINDLAQVGAIDGTLGCSRLALTDEDAEGRRLVITWMQDLGTVSYTHLTLPTICSV